MIRSSFEFVRPKELEANAPPEARGGARDAVRLLVSNASGSEHRNFGELPELMAPGDLLVVNESATLAASLPARGPAGEFLLNVCTRYGDRIRLAEPRWGVGRPGPIPLTPATPIEAGGVRLAPIGPYPDISRLWFFRAGGDLERAMREVGRPIRYGYVPESYPLETYQTVFSRVPGSAEMPSAGRPFTHRLVEALEKRGVGIAPLVLHTGVSSLESEPDGLEIPPVYPEPFDVPSATAERINATATCRSPGGRGRHDRGPSSRDRVERLPGRPAAGVHPADPRSRPFGPLGRRTDHRASRPSDVPPCPPLRVRGRAEGPGRLCGRRAGAVPLARVR